MLVGKKKIKFKPSATSIAKEQETEPSSIHSTGATTENLGGEGGRHQHQAEPQLAHVCTKLIASWGRFGWPLLQLLFLASICPWWGAGNRAGPNGSHPLCCNCLGSPLHHLLAVLLHTPNASYIHISRTQPL